ncbi:unnamed protein product [Orchesella dallaii]|uniref:SAC3/GANP/THP3 conserved domain-containing protein n=1 Tax=Orchesella dallaii TaxID=48710 RepID=A0ABP1QNL4_9HEXA
MNNEIFIVGICQNMCPEAEIREREKAGLIHVFEKSDDQKLPNSGRENERGSMRGQNRRYQRGIRELIKADKNRAVKSYTRPAAGVNKSKPSDLRPPPVLMKTVAYLCKEVLIRTDQPFIEVYDFVFDRLRAVRQDMVIQRISNESALVLLEAIIKFHLYAEYRFRSNAPPSYDPCINQKHLKDCLKTLLSTYELNNYRGSSRPFFEALYCLGSPESYEVISRAFQIRNEMKEATVFLNALDICLSIQNRNFYQFFQLLDELPPLLAAYTAQRVPFMRKHALKAMMITYGVQTCKVPLEWVEDMLCYPNAVRTEKDLIRIGSQIIFGEEKGEKFVKFSKSSSFLKEDTASVDNDVKFTVMAGLNNLEVVVTEQICPWGHQYL